MKEKRPTSITYADLFEKEMENATKKTNNTQGGAVGELRPFDVLDEIKAQAEKKAKADALAAVLKERMAAAEKKKTLDQRFSDSEAIRASQNTGRGALVDAAGLYDREGMGAASVDRNRLRELAGGKTHEDMGNPYLRKKLMTPEDVRKLTEEKGFGDTKVGYTLGTFGVGVGKGAADAVDAASVPLYGLSNVMSGGLILERDRFDREKQAFIENGGWSAIPGYEDTADPKVLKSRFQNGARLYALCNTEGDLQISPESLGERDRADLALYTVAKADYEKAVDLANRESEYVRNGLFGTASDFAREVKAEYENMYTPDEKGMLEIYSSGDTPVSRVFDKHLGDYGQHYEEAKWDRIENGEFLGDTVAAYQEKRKAEYEEENGEIKGFFKRVDDTAFSVGQMMPRVAVETAANFLLPGSGKILGGLFSYSSGDLDGKRDYIATMRAINAKEIAEGKDPVYTEEQIRQNATLGGIVEGLNNAVGESIIGGVGGIGKGILDGAAKKIFSKAWSKAINPILGAGLSYLKSIVGNGVEEGIQKLVSHGMKNAILGTDDAIEWNELLYEMEIGSFMGGVMGLPGGVVDTVMAVDAVNGIKDYAKKAAATKNNALATVELAIEMEMAKYATEQQIAQLAQMKGEQAEKALSILKWQRDSLDGILGKMDAKAAFETVAQNNTAAPVETEAAADLRGGVRALMKDEGGVRAVPGDSAEVVADDAGVAVHEDAADDAAAFEDADLDGAQFSIKKTHTIDYATQLRALENGQMSRSDSLYIGTPSSALQNNGISSAAFAMDQGDYRKSRRAAGKNAHYSAHNVPFAFFQSMPTYLSKPVMLIDNGERVSIVTEYGMKDKKGNPSYVIVGVQKDAKMETDTVNQIKSVYPLDDFGARMTMNAEAGKLVILDKKKADEMLSEAGIETSVRQHIINLSSNSISHVGEIVKGDSQISSPEAKSTPVPVNATAESLGLIDNETFRTGREHGADVETIRFAQQVAAVTGVPVSFFNTPANGDYIRNGYYFKGKIYINVASDSPRGLILMHELTHSIEGTKAYRRLNALVLRRIKQEGKDLEAMLRKKELVYTKAGIELAGRAAAEAEVVAEYLEEHLLDNWQAISELAKQERSAVQAIKDFFDDLLKRLRALFGDDSVKEADFIRRTRDLYAKALGQRTGDMNAEAKNSISIKHTDGTVEELADARGLTNEQAIDYLTKAKNGEIRRNSYIPVRSDTPQVIRDTLEQVNENVDNLSLVMQVRKAQQAMGDEQPGNRTGKSGNNIRKHAMTPREIVDIMNRLDEPSTIIYQTNRRDKNGKQLPNNVAVLVEYNMSGNEDVAVIEFDSSIDPEYIGTKYGDTSYHTVVTVFRPDTERDGMPFDYVEELLSNPDNIELDIVRRQPARSATGEKHPNTSSKLPSAPIVSQKDAVVKGEERKYSVSGVNDGAQDDGVEISIPGDADAPPAWSGQRAGSGDFRDILPRGSIASERTVADRERAYVEGRKYELSREYIAKEKAANERKDAVAKKAETRRRLADEKMRARAKAMLGILGNFAEKGYFKGTSTLAEHEGALLNMDSPEYQKAHKQEIKYARAIARRAKAEIDGDLWATYSTSNAAEKAELRKIHPELANYFEAEEAAKKARGLGVFKNERAKYAFELSSIVERAEGVEGYNSVLEYLRGAMADTEKRMDAAKSDRARKSEQKLLHDLGATLEKLSALAEDYALSIENADRQLTQAYASIDRELGLDRVMKAYSSYDRRGILNRAGLPLDATPAEISAKVEEIRARAEEKYLEKQKAGAVNSDDADILTLQEDWRKEVLPTEEELLSLMSEEERALYELNEQETAAFDEEHAARMQAAYDSLPSDMDDSVRRADAFKLVQRENRIKAAKDIDAARFEELVAQGMDEEQAAVIIKNEQAKREREAKKNGTGMKKLGIEIAGAITDEYQEAELVIDSIKKADRLKKEIDDYAKQFEISKHGCEVAEDFARGRRSKDNAMDVYFGGMRGDGEKHLTLLADMYENLHSAQSVSTQTQRQKIGRILGDQFEAIVGDNDLERLFAHGHAKGKAGLLTLNAMLPESVPIYAFGNNDVGRAIRDTYITPVADNSAAKDRKIKDIGKMLEDLHLNRAQSALLQVVVECEGAMEDAKIHLDRETIMRILRGDATAEAVLNDAAGSVIPKDYAKAIKLLDKKLDDVEKQIRIDELTVKTLELQANALKEKGESTLSKEKEDMLASVRARLTEEKARRAGLLEQRTVFEGRHYGLYDLRLAFDKITGTIEGLAKKAAKKRVGSLKWESMTEDARTAAVKEERSRIADAYMDKVTATAPTVKDLLNNLYDAINEVYVTHGKAPIPFRKNYMPHSQPDEVRTKLAEMARFVGLEAVSELPSTIAGVTQNFSPNAKFFAHGLERKTDVTVYDATENVFWYADSALETIYHMDDIMRAKDLEARLRAYHTDKVEYAKQVLSYLYDYGDSEEDLEKRAEMSEAMKGDGTTLSSFAIWLHNYWHDLAGKQIFSRDLEQKLGRDKLNWAARYLSMSTMSQLAGNVGSSLKQISQVPMVVADAGLWRTTLLLRDAFRGDNSFENLYHLSERSSVLAEVESFRKKLHTDDHVFLSMDTAFLLSRLMSNLMTRTAYYAYFQKALDAGLDVDAAIQRADRETRKIMSSRMKGAQPIIYSSKDLLDKVVTLYQRETVAGWEWLLGTKESVREYAELHEDKVRREHPGYSEEKIKRIAKRNASDSIAKRMVVYQLTAHAFNTVFELMGLGSPVLFDMIGLFAGDFFADVIRGLFDNVGEDEEDRETIREILEEACKEWNLDPNEMASEVIDDIPFLGNIMTILGLREMLGLEDSDRLPISLPDVYGGIQALRRGDIFEGIMDIGAPFMPFGTQIKKTVGGLITMHEGGSKREDGRYNYMVDRGNVFEWIRAILFGTYATEGAREWVDNDFKAYSKAASTAYDSMTMLGVDADYAKDLVREVSRAEGTEERSKADVQQEIIANAKLEPTQSAALYRDMVASETQKEAINAAMAVKSDNLSDVVALAIEMRENPLKGDRASAILGSDISVAQKEAIYRSIYTPDEKEIDDFKRAGMSFDDYLASYCEYLKLSENKDLSGDQRSVRLYMWAEDRGLSKKQIELVLESNGYEGTPKTFSKYLDAGLSSDAALDAMTALKGKKKDGEKISAILGAKMSNKERMTALSVALDDSVYERIAKGIDQGLTLSMFDRFYKKADTDSNGRISNAERTHAVQTIVFERDQRSALWIATGGGESSDPWGAGASKSENSGFGIVIPSFEIDIWGGK